MKKRLAETYWDGGLVVPPFERGCVGANCWIEGRFSRGRFIPGCFIDEHHQYFEEDDYDFHPDEAVRPLAREFRHHPYNIIAMARCAHSLEHQRTERVPVPQPEVMEAFLYEAKILTRLEVRLDGYMQLEAVLQHDLPRTQSEWNDLTRQHGKDFCTKLWMIREERERAEKEQRRAVYLEEIMRYRQEAERIEVLPLEVIKRATRSMKRRGRRMPLAVSPPFDPEALVAPLVAA